MKQISAKLSPKYFKLKKLFQITTIAFLPLLINSCTSVPKYDQISGGLWEARTLVKDLKNSKTYLVNIDFLAQKPDSLRADVTTPIGAHVISFAQQSKKMSYIIPQRKLYYSGALSNQAFSELISHPFDTTLLFHVLYDQPIAKKGWVCKSDTKNLIESCVSKSQGLKIEWMQRRGVEKTVEITHAAFELQFQFHTFKEKSEFKQNTFDIAAPQNYKKL